MDADPHPGAVGRLPWPVWMAVIEWMSPPAGSKDHARRGAVLELRRVCRALGALVREDCAAGAGELNVMDARRRAQLEAGPSAGLGRALAVWAALTDAEEDEMLEMVAALATAVARGHMIWFRAADGDCTRAVMSAAEEMLLEASRKGLLECANFCTALGWETAMIAQLRSIELSGPNLQEAGTIAKAGVTERIVIWHGVWEDMSILASLREVTLRRSVVEDLSGLADVPKLVVRDCAVAKLPAMRNAWLEVHNCRALTDVSGLAGGRVGRLLLSKLDGVADVSAIGAMRPRPHAVILKRLADVEDVSMLAGVHLLEVVDCPKLDKAATLAALEGKVGTIQWYKSGQ